MRDSVGLYLDQIGAVPLLSALEERELAQVIESGTSDEAAAAKDRFIRANLRLVVSIARRYPLPHSMDLLDLVQEGNLGLEHAVDKFDWRKGFKFSTYATFWIRQAIGRALDQKANLVRLPGDRAASLRASLREAAGEGSELDDGNAALQRLITPTSLDRPVGDGGRTELVDLVSDDGVGPEQAAIALADRQIVRSFLDALDARARRAVERRFGLHDGRQWTYTEIGDELGVTSEAARRLVARSVESVRERVRRARDDAA